MKTDTSTPAEEDLKSELEPKDNQEELEKYLKRQRLKSLVYAVINAAGLADSITLLVHAVDISHTQIVLRALGVLVWVLSHFI